MEPDVTGQGANPIDLHTLMENVLSRITPRADRKSVGLVTVSPAHFPPIAVNESIVTPLISDLVEKLMALTAREQVYLRARIIPTGSLPFELRQGDIASEDAREGPWALLTISDQGAALLPQNERESAHQIDRDILDELISRVSTQLIAEGGALFAESLNPEQSRVWVALPLQLESHDETDVSRLRETIETRLQDSEESNVKLLVQAESDDLRAKLSENLVEGGYYVIGVRSAGEVLQYARREMPDLIILDLQSRDPSAMDLALMLRGEPGFPEIPILFLTEITGPGIGRRMDTVDFLIQPEGASAILRTVDQVLHSGLPPVGRIMVVESEDALREEMLGTIQAQGYPVVEARSAEEALALAERVNIGIVFANIGLAEARDYWLVRQLRQLSEDIEIYLMTEGAQSVDEMGALRRGIAGYGDTGRLRELLARVEEDKDDPDEDS